jgi:putative ABC transport system permease protein
MREFRKARPIEEVDAELDFHVEMRTRELVAAGVDPESARRQAVARFGDYALVGDTCKSIATQRENEMRRTEYFAELRQDTRFAIRQLMRTPTFTIIAALTIALGIGATTAIFSAVRAVVLRPFAYANQDRVMYLMERWRDNDGNVSVGNYTDWKARARSFDVMGAASYTSVTLADGANADRVFAARATASFFSVFGVAPIQGRVFTAAEDEPGRDQVVVLSQGLWQQRYGGASDMLGKSIMINGRPHTVIGVMPASFDPLLSQEQLWIPAAFTAEQKVAHDGHFLNVFAVRKKGVTPEQAQRDLDGVMKVLVEQFPQENGTRGVRAAGLDEILVGDYRQRLFVMLGAVTLVLLIACGNVANLLLARGAGRSQELAIRTAIGAGRSRITRQLLTESLVLAAIGAAGGIALAWAAIRAFIGTAPAGIPRIAETRIDGTVLLFTLGAAIASALVFGLVPAFRASRHDLANVIKSGGRAGSGSSRDRVRGVLVVAEVALALTLLVGAGLLVRTAIHLNHVDPGFELRGLLAARVALPFAGRGRPQDRSPEQVVATFDRMIERVRAIPGVREASITSQAPMGPGGNSNGIIPEGKALSPENAVDARLRMVSSGYFRTMGIQLRAGRDFNSGDIRQSTHVAVISEEFAKKAWPDQNAIGKRFACCEGGPNGEPIYKTVVGIARDVRSFGPTRDATAEFYLPIAQVPPEAWEWISRAMTIVVRSSAADPLTMTAGLRQAVKDVEPGVPVYAIATLEESLRATIAPARFNTMLLAALGGIGLLLAAMGIYSVIAYFVSLRTHEIGVRMALGASGGDVLRLMTWQGMRPVLVGVALGGAGAFWATKLLASSLFGVSATDPLTFVVVATGLIVVAVIATLVPARRATRIDPTRALSG